MLETVWFILWGVLWAVYFVLDGFDLGLGSLIPFLGKTDDDRRTLYSAMAPFWDGNEVWLITAGGVTFAAFPGTYAVMFSALYTPLMILLFALILRAVAFEFREQLASPFWKRLWDCCLFLGSLIPALLLGVAFANLFKGIPIDSEGVYKGTLFTLLNPYGLLGGILFVLLFAHHGSLWLCTRTEGAIKETGSLWAKRLWALVVVAAILFLSASAWSTDLYANYTKFPLLFILPALAVVGLLGSRLEAARGNWWRAWGASAITIFAATLFGVAGMYPRMIPSSLDPSFSLTIYNASSSALTLGIMLGVALVFVPIVILYQAWVYRVFSTRVRPTERGAKEGLY